jgi:hypothetical protein
MYITASTTHREITLTARAFKEEELSEVLDLLDAAHISFRIKTGSGARFVERSRRGLFKQRFVFPRHEASRLEYYYGIRLHGNAIRVHPDQVGRGFSQRDAVAFKCMELCRNRSEGSGCVGIMARSLSEAKIKCGLLARTHRWFGALSLEGTCG